MSLLPGILKGLVTTARTALRPTHTAEYPDVAPDLPPRSRGVIALLEENCTSCMLCARECPDWCIYIDSHKETIPATTEGGRDRQRNVLDRFAIDFSLCMYCGICIEVCPFDALHWSPQFEYAEVDILDLLHEKERLGGWMATVPPPPALDEKSAEPAEVAAANKPARGTGLVGAGGARRRWPGSPDAAHRASAPRRGARRRGAGAVARAVATDSRRFSPPDSVNGFAAARCPSRSRSSSSSARRWASASPTPVRRGPRSSSSRTVPVRNWCSGSWKTVPMRRTSSRAGHRAIGSRPWPASSASPAMTAPGPRREEAGQQHGQRRLSACRSAR